jgi:hypothetical protein
MAPEFQIFCFQITNEITFVTPLVFAKTSNKAFSLTSTLKLGFE